MPLLQDIIHKLEEGGGLRYFRYVVLALALMMFTVLYDLRAFRNFSTQEAMDSAQLARNISEGKGYTTDFVRPFSMYLAKQANLKKLGPPPAGTAGDYSRIKDKHPDL